MNYWHIQMNLPEGRESRTKIDSSLMLKEPKPIIGTGEWDDLQCRYFKNIDGHGLLIGDILLVREGKKPLAIVQVVGDNFLDINLTNKFINQNFREVKIIGWFKDKEEFPQPQGTLQKLINKKTDSYIFIKNWHRKMIEEKNNNNIIELLKSKFQIILQGPPGTGKTRLANIIGHQIIGEDKEACSYESIKNSLSQGLKIPNSSGVPDYYTIEEIKERSVVLSSDKTTKHYEPKYSNIRKKIIELEKGLSPDNIKGLNPYEVAVAKYLFEHPAFNSSSEQLELIQFHPSYTYEDFVRGIEAKGSEAGIEYRTVDKVLAKIASKANNNWNDFHSNPKDLQRKDWIENKLSEFLSEFSMKLASNEDGKQMLTDSIYVYEVEEDCLRYKGDNWVSPSRVNFIDLKKIISYNLQNSEENIVIPQSISNHAFYRKSYYTPILKEFFESAGEYVSNVEKSVELKNYVLIIDEINRANLPSVLGELIYALEYRGKSINSMYEINKESKIVLPKNLFIIGTMNTADRSVGHIDYAIRRRFAFVDVLPTIEPIDTIEGKELFKKVSNLFKKIEDGKEKPSDHLSPDFSHKEVQVGHSYFLGSVDKLNFRLEYEVKPILREYLKDGILMSSAEDLIESLTV